MAKLIEIGRNEPAKIADCKKYEWAAANWVFRSKFKIMITDGIVFKHEDTTRLAFNNVKPKDWYFVLD